MKKNNVKRITAIILVMVIAVVTLVPVRIAAKTTYVTKKEINKDIKQLTDLVNSGYASGDDRYILRMLNQVLKHKVDLSGNENTAYVGDEGKMHYTWKNVTEDTNYKEYKGIKWSSSNSKVIKINSRTGKIKCLKKGTVTITATAISSGKKTKHKITVIDPVYD